MDLLDPAVRHLYSPRGYSLALGRMAVELALSAKKGLAPFDESYLVLLTQRLIEDDCPYRPIGVFRSLLTGAIQPTEDACMYDTVLWKHLDSFAGYFQEMSSQTLPIGLGDPLLPEAFAEAVEQVRHYLPTGNTQALQRILDGYNDLNCGRVKPAESFLLLEKAIRA